jgi:SAP domain-containing new25
MSTLKSKKKSELQAIAIELGVNVDGSKSDLEARILHYLSEHAELKSSPKFSRYYASIESPAPRRKLVPAKKSTDLGDTIPKAMTR